MADNQYVNKVEWNGGTLIDLTTDDVSRADVALGKTFHLPSGEQTTGTSAGAGGAYNIVSTIDENDKQHLAITDAQGGTTIEPLSVTANGTYEESGKAYSPVVVNVQPDLIDTTITSNGTYTHSGHDGYDNVVVNVPETRIGTKTVNITQNGNIEVSPDSGYDALSRVYVNVNVAGSSIHHATVTEYGIGSLYVAGAGTPDNYVVVNRLTDILSYIPYMPVVVSAQSETNKGNSWMYYSGSNHVFQLDCTFSDNYIRVSESEFDGTYDVYWW